MSYAAALPAFSACRGPGAERSPRCTTAAAGKAGRRQRCPAREARCARLRPWAAGGQARPDQADRAPPPEPVKADPEATRVLDEAVKTLEKNPIQWLKTELWQQMDVQGLMVQCDGLFMYGPNYKLHLNLNLRRWRRGPAADHYLRRQHSMGGPELSPSKKEVQRIDWAKVVKTLSQPGVDPQEREQFVSSLSSSGVLPLLKSLRQDLALTKHEKTRWNDRDVIKLTGVWGGKIISAPVPAVQWPGALPRQCCLYLDSKTSFPYRVEWWGPSSPGLPDSTLLQLEFRDPKLNVGAVAGPHCRFLNISPATVQVQDLTNQLVGALQSNFDRRRGASRRRNSRPKKASSSLFAC